MDERPIYDAILMFWCVLAMLSCPVLFLKTAPYGRHSLNGWGRLLSSRVGWALMEAPAVLVPLACFAWAKPAPHVWLFLLLWEVHYVHRTVVFPLRMQADVHRMPLSVVALAFLFNCVNGYLIGRWLTEWGDYPSSWFGDPRALVGLGLFAAGMLVNWQSDGILRRLRQGRRADVGYAVPQGGLFAQVSCPNYLGEIVEWIGWAVLTWSLPGAAFALWTVANLVPRAYANHRWYRQTFRNYPPERRALIPGIF